MTTKRFDDNPALKAYAGTEVIPLQALDGGTDTDDNPVAVGDDAKISLRDLAGLKIHAVSVASGTATINCGHGLARRHTLSLTGNVTMALADCAPSGYATEGEVRIVQDATGSRTVTFPAGWKPLGGSDTAVASAAGAVTWLTFVSYDGGTTVSYAMQERGA
ncbi:hypothetical protein [Pseudoxanthomonas sp. GW2]|jgi:hypothetical protein|uniref:hypothetical protein n=1 Tax=Pseudoxanthomonas sp. GW2 TaxID=1211114 RepID=UPI000301C715|nr:hypothetical protein [Pseudoxanthomonas sp. GW2]